MKFQRDPPRKEHAKALESFQQAAGKADRRAHLVPLVEVQSTHFISYRSRGPREHDSCKRAARDAYAAVSKQFGIPVTENVFVGKTADFMFASGRITTFGQHPGSRSRRLDQNIDGTSLQGRRTGHMACRIPDSKNYGANAKTGWAYTLNTVTHYLYRALPAPSPDPAMALTKGFAEWIA